MSQEKSVRGRPKGSGLVDGFHLKAIAELISADPRLRPTTAIRNLGITDPSAVRRLRDKFKSMQMDLIGEESATAAVRQPTVSQTGARTVALHGSRTPRRTSSPQEAPPAASKSSKPKIAIAEVQTAVEAAVPSPDKAGNPLAMFYCAYGFGLQAMTALLDVQLAVVKHTMCSPVAKAAIRNQLWLTEFAVASVACGAAHRKSLHRTHSAGPSVLERSAAHPKMKSFAERSSTSTPTSVSVPSPMSMTTSLPQIDGNWWA